MTSGRICYGLLAIGLVCVSGPHATAALVVADFNDLSTGNLNGKAGGTGFSGNWDAGTGTIKVIPGDLTSTLYNIQQTGTAQSVRGDHHQARQQNRALASSMSGEIWFSFLANNPNSNSRAGISLNASGWPAPSSESVLFLGDDFRVYLNGSFTSISDATSLGKTTLVVGQMIVGAGDDTLNVWVDPDLMSDYNIFNHTKVFSDSTTDFASSISRVGVISYRYGSGGTIGGTVDAVRFSDTAMAFYDVTGVTGIIPEPSTLLIWALLAGLGIGVRWRRRK